MKREYDLDQVVRDDRSVITVGTFDGVHEGHRAILRYLVERARDYGGSSVVVSFNPHPREVVRGEAVPLLTTIEERAEELERLGLDRFIVIPFTPKFAARSPEDFVETILVEKIGVREIVIGYDHGFGKGRGGDSILLQKMGRRLGFSVDVIPAQIIEEHIVSSTEVRYLLAETGDMPEAARLLGRFYSLSGTVVEGAKRGRRIGFPTANILVNHPRKVVPREGVYAVRVATEPGPARYGGMMNIGRRPTFEGTELHQEVHLFDFEGDLYDRQLRIEFVERTRDEQKFASVSGLIGQLSEDRLRCMAALKNRDAMNA